MKKERGDHQKQTANVEFGMEFGDLNASKHYEIPFNFKAKDKQRKK